MHWPTDRALVQFQVGEKRSCNKHEKKSGDK